MNYEYCQNFESLQKIISQNKNQKICHIGMIKIADLKKLKFHLKINDYRGQAFYLSTATPLEMLQELLIYYVNTHRTLPRYNEHIPLVTANRHKPGDVIEPESDLEVTTLAKTSVTPAVTECEDQAMIPPVNPTKQHGYVYLVLGHKYQRRLTVATQKNDQPKAINENQIEKKIVRNSSICKDDGMASKITVSVNVDKNDNVTNINSKPQRKKNKRVDYEQLEWAKQNKEFILSHKANICVI